MYFYAILILILIFSGCNKSGTILVSTVNLQNDLVYDNDLAEIRSLATVKKILSTEDNDIICLQGINSYQILALPVVFDDYIVVGTKNDTKNGDHHINDFVPILIKKDDFTLLTKSWFKISQESDNKIENCEKNTHIVRWVKLKNNKTGHIFFVYNTHFCNIDDEYWKGNSAFLIKTIIETSGNAPVILTGSYYSKKQQVVYDILTSNWDRFLSLQDSYELFSGANHGPESWPENNNHLLVNSYLSVISHKTLPFLDEKETSPNSALTTKLKFLFERRSRKGNMVAAPWENYQ